MVIHVEQTNWRRITLIIFVLLALLGLGVCLATFRWFWGSTPDVEALDTIVNAGFTLSSITIGVVALLLTMYVTQDLKKAENHKWTWIVLILSLTLASLLGFATSFIAFAIKTGLCSHRLRAALPYQFLTVLYLLSMALLGSVIEIITS